ncbi:uncharacterized protein GIQ15_03968 [Arthroderma uncinatum]|uniref:uncharacterized protein n=1 Tax=Arthroderma uncinatum TaxID=74035 RepID=UPI00144AA088|nr:uncharacterized protein GIQ15_03968 [Arthroderma uncinatum]KAF3481209.1 hypothetical protein GIQ15_03968 [Arthroderma uncinatum]
MLKTGKSQHELITRERMMQDMLFRDAADADGKRYYGNFLRNTDTFDHKFFKRSPRESQAMDPQCRISLQAAYQAVEQSGYFTESKTKKNKEAEHIGCYLGVCGVDYEHNISCHAPSPFTATGGLRGFITGLIAHFFGFTGPAMTFDTACSSSTVAMHTACRNLLSGETTAALVGGVNVITNMQWLQNFSAGSFLNPIGQCKPFDRDADGYCRAEGVAFVFLKKLSDAKAAGNMVLGTIKATAVNQNLNVTPLFVPNVPSLSKLFRGVIRKAGVDPSEKSLVEAHGTGTPVGDPAEYESVKLAVSSSHRNTAVAIGSVKGHVGHTEGASGVIALVKVLMMMRDGFIPPQASFTRMNPHIHTSAADMIEVVTELRPWPADRKIALLNNYGACGSNASLIRVRVGDIQKEATLADVAFNMARQSNPGVPQGLVFSCRSLEELQEKLALAAAATKETAASARIAVAKTERPDVLCFGGQNSKFIGLDRALYEGVAILRQHLDACDAAITAMGLSSIFPSIFSREPIQDVVQLQMALFAIQYASARVWMDCGLAAKIVSVVGHSFGEITALCVSANPELARAGIKSKRLNVTNAFHSMLVENLVGELGNIGRGLTFNGAVIPVERATEHDSTDDPLDWTFVPSHMRRPVYFNHAVQQLAKKYPQAIFLEAGSNSTITMMVSKALAQVTLASPDSLAFHALSITNTEKGFDALTDATAGEYTQLLLPPYQFEKFRHRPDVKSPTEVVTNAAQAMIAAGGYTTAGATASATQMEGDARNLLIWTFIGYQDTKRDKRNLSSLDKTEMKWHFSLHSVSNGNGDSNSQAHAEAVIRMRAPADASFLQKFGYYERLVSHEQCQSLLKLNLEDDGVEVLHGRNLYRAFSEIVDFGPVYRGVKYIVGRRGESAGVIHKRHQGHTWLDVPMSDSFGQAAGIHMNLLTESLSPTNMFIANGCELPMRSPKAPVEMSGKENGPGIWHVHARHTRQSDNAYITDVFVFDAATGELAEVMLGLQYTCVPKASMSKILARFTKDQEFLRKPAAVESASAATAIAAAPPATVTATTSKAVKSSAMAKKPKKKTRDITEEVCNLVANVSGVEPSEMTLDSEMADLGIDSLMGMELAREV